MPKKPVSLTLDVANLAWLRGRARVSAGGNLSEAVNRIIAEVRTGGPGAPIPARSVVRTIDIAPQDDGLITADAAVRSLVASSLGRPLAMGEPPRPARRRTTASPRARRGHRG
jgi:hypothetical protein